MEYSHCRIQSTPNHSNSSHLVSSRPISPNIQTTYIPTTLTLPTSIPLTDGKRRHTKSATRKDTTPQQPERGHSHGSILVSGVIPTPNLGSLQRDHAKPVGNIHSHGTAARNPSRSRVGAACASIPQHLHKRCIYLTSHI